ncbi:MAG: hypothetical protein VZR29_04485 [Lachnospiraceae bacterium]|nr:hypothetical protein [Lachnospiraceae bacterium]MEE3379523.1 hypothetical protein [Lachnospiraceae bacterium]MEE3433450.1 hypothetical protein [Lachnospiraceae bacterium]
MYNAVRERINALHLIQKMEEEPELARSLGIIDASMFDGELVHKDLADMLPKKEVSMDGLMHTTTIYGGWKGF